MAEIEDSVRVGFAASASLRSIVSGENRRWIVGEGRRGGDAESVCIQNVAEGGRSSWEKSGWVGWISRILRCVQTTVNEKEREWVLLGVPKTLPFKLMSKRVLIYHTHIWEW